MTGKIEARLHTRSTMRSPRQLTNPQLASAERNLRTGSLEAGSELMDIIERSSPRAGFKIACPGQTPTA